MRFIKTCYSNCQNINIWDKNFKVKHNSNVYSGDIKLSQSPWHRNHDVKSKAGCEKEDVEESDLEDMFSESFHLDDDAELGMHNLAALQSILCPILSPFAIECSILFVFICHLFISPLLTPSHSSSVRPLLIHGSGL